MLAQRCAHSAPDKSSTDCTFLDIWSTLPTTHKMSTRQEHNINIIIHTNLTHPLLSHGLILSKQGLVFILRHISHGAGFRRLWRNMSRFDWVCIVIRFESILFCYFLRVFRDALWLQSFHSEIFTVVRFCFTVMYWIVGICGCMFMVLLWCQSCF